MTPTDLSILILVVLFFLTLVPRANLGLAAFAASWLVALCSNISTDQLISYFPSDFFILIAGVMCLFGVLQVTGAMDWLLQGSSRIVGNRRALVPMIPFVIGALLAGIGTMPLAAVAIIAPIGMGLAKKHGIPLFLMAFAMMNGVLSGLFSPVAVFGLTANKQLVDLGVPLPPQSSLVIFLTLLVLGVVLTAVITFFYRKQLSVINADFTEGTAVATVKDSISKGFSASLVKNAGLSHQDRVIALAGFVLLIVAGIVFGLNLGYTAFVISFTLILILRLEPGKIIAAVPWGVIVLIGGLLTYVNLMQELGSFERLSELLTVENSPTLSLLILCYIAAVTSFLANSIAVIVTTLPLLPPLINAGIDPLGSVMAILFSAVLVDNNPVGSAGGLVIGAASPASRHYLFRSMLAYGLGAVLLSPILMWLLFGLW